MAKVRPAMRIDYLLSDEEREQRSNGGPCQALCAIIFSLLGLILLIASFLLLRTDRLQFQNYIDVNYPFYYKPFPATTLGCAAATTAISIVQLIGSLMYIFEDIKIGPWKWLKFTVLMICSSSIMLLSTEDNSDMHLYRFYFVTLCLNTITSVLFLSADLICCNCKKQNIARPY